ncbi:unnamed protein product [Brachionus calyciflorus]|uniref:Uncharacterized protein n=1 Tax=Brachionus calyciflorus TaxID=104777 RepID=A0A814BVA3_9BILA|nr:unnamed protein product [Brachionus calyciflorus]
MVQTKPKLNISCNLTSSFKKSMNKQQSKSPNLTTNNFQKSVPEILVDNRKLSFVDLNYDFNENDEYDTNDTKNTKQKNSPVSKLVFFKKENSTKRHSISDLKPLESSMSRRSSIKSNNLTFRNENSTCNNRRNSIMPKEPPNSHRNSMINSFFDLDLNNHGSSRRIKHHITALLSYDAQIAMLQVYEEMIVNELTKLNFDPDNLPRITITSKQKENESSDLYSNDPITQNEILETKRLKISYLVEIASKIIDLIESSKKRNINCNKSDHLSLFRQQADSASVMSYYQSNSFDSLDLYDPLEVFTKWISLCTNELKN